MTTDILLHCTHQYNPLFDINLIGKTIPEHHNLEKQRVKISPVCQPVKLMFAIMQAFRQKSLSFQLCGYKVQ